jgi:thioredoxin reductase (NADPH)
VKDQQYPKQPVAETPGIRRVYDVAVVGGGPAGLSCAVYLARFERSVLVIDAGEGRSTAHQVNENYLGFPRGIAARELRRKGAAQAKRFGADIVEARVSSVRRNGGGFELRCGRRTVRASAIVIATGVHDHLPEIEGVERHLGRSLFWCITCDGWRARGKRLVLIGRDDEAATTAMQFQAYTDRITLVTNARRIGCSREKQGEMRDCGIDVVRGRVTAFEGSRRGIRAVVTDKGERLPADLVFSLQGSSPNNELARKLKLKLREGFIVVDSEQRTSEPRVYAAGDITKHHAHQVVTAAHEGAMAAQAANYDLYAPNQRE